MLKMKNFIFILVVAAAAEKASGPIYARKSVLPFVTSVKQPRLIQLTSAAWSGVLCLHPKTVIFWRDMRRP